MSDTVYFKIKLKRTRNPQEVFEKMVKKIKKKGPTKNWTYDIQENHILVDFHDDKSEPLFIEFINKEANGFCKVDFPMEKDMFDDKSSEFVAFMDLLLAARTSFSKSEFSDDYGLVHDYFESKRVQIKFRELTDEEFAKTKRIYDMGYKKYFDNVMLGIYEDLQIPLKDDYHHHVNMEIPYAKDYMDLPGMYGLLPFFETYLFETSEYMELGPLYKIPAFYEDLTGVWFSTMAFSDGMVKLSMGGKDTISPMSAKEMQAYILFTEKVVPLLNNEEIDDFEKCILAQRYFLSIFDYCGFKRSTKVNFPPENYCIHN